MHEFRVWAPAANTVNLLLREQSVPMEKTRDGYWCATVADAGHGAAYAFSIDGGEPLPDPRSPWQPDGIHGFSCVLDHARFEWTDTHWQARPLASAVSYELHIGTFTPEGTFESAISKLDYLVDLGITHIELMPVAEFSGAAGWGYDGVDLYAPHQAYGGPEALKRFVNAAHEKGLAAILDVVYNHLGPAGNYLPRFGPYFTDRHATPWGPAVNLDGPMSHHVRRFFIDNALMWLRDYHFDGLRIDAVHALIDSGAVHFLEQLSTEVEKLAVQLGRHLFLIAESDLNNPRVIMPRETGGYGIDAQWSDDFHHALHAVLTGESAGYYSDFGQLRQIVKAVTCVFVYDGAYSPYRNRPHGRPVKQLPGYSFLGYIQNHDQVGNRAKGERVSDLTNLRRAKIAAGLVMTSPFVPMLFQGEEWAASTPFLYFTRHEDKELGEAVSHGRRSEFVDFGWAPEQVPDPQDEATFLRSKLRWEELAEQPHAEMLDWYRTLIQLRRARPSLLNGNLELVEAAYDETDRWLAIVRERLAIVCNLGPETRSIPLPRPAARVLVASDGDPRIEDRGATLESDTLAVMELSEEK